MRTLKSCVLLSIFFILTACGNKGPVRPLEVPLPGSVSAAELRQQGDALLLGWQLPTRNLDGSPLQQPPVVDIYRMTFDPENDCPECFDRSTLLASINPQLPKPALQVGPRYLLYDLQVQAGIGYQYKLVTRNLEGQLGKPVILRQTCRQAVPAPQQFRVTPQDRSALLQWQPPSLPDGDTLLGYQLYRRLDGGSSFYPINPQPLQQLSFEDFSLNNGSRYYYRVRALVKRGTQQLEGLATPELNVIPKAGI
ncbi:MAG: fibronectin type III domain-containing protein [Deltaproteobacteria bacterium]|nr:fibronectin type III domain-containing protein [Deltaproteobacteria bacterium]